MGSQGPVGPLDPWALWTWPLDPVPFGPKCPRIPSFSTIFSVARVVEKSTVLGIQSVDSMNPWRVWAHHSFNKDCSQSFSGPSGRPKEPTTGPTFSPFFFVACVFEKSTLSGARSVDSLLQSFLGPLGPQGVSFNRDLRVTRSGLRTGHKHFMAIFLYFPIFPSRSTPRARCRLLRTFEEPSSFSALHSTQRLGVPRAPNRFGGPWGPILIFS